MIFSKCRKDAFIRFRSRIPTGSKGVLEQVPRLGSFRRESRNEGRGGGGWYLDSKPVVECEGDEEAGSETKCGETDDNDVENFVGEKEGAGGQHI